METSIGRKPKFRIIVKDIEKGKIKLFTVYNGKVKLENFFEKVKEKVQEIK